MKTLNWRIVSAALIACLAAFGLAGCPQQDDQPVETPTSDVVPDNDAADDDATDEDVPGDMTDEDTPGDDTTDGDMPGDDMTDEGPMEDHEDDTPEAPTP